MRLIPCTGERFMVAGGGRFLLSRIQEAGAYGYARLVHGYFVKLWSAHKKRLAPKDGMD